MNKYQATIALVRSTGKALKERLYSAPLNVQRKENNHQNLVTDLDVWVQGELIKGLIEIEPGADIFAEEQKNHEVCGLTWYIDPIDGTTNFISAARDFAVCVALYNGNMPIFGIVYDVIRDCCYHAMTGCPAYINEQRLPQRHLVALENVLFDASLPTMNGLSRRAGRPLYYLSRATRGHRAIGSASLAMCHIAEGSLDVYISNRLYPWDYAASGIILNAAGGVYCSIFDEPLFAMTQTTMLCCGDSTLSEQFLPFLRGEECSLAEQVIGK